jgi:fibronectin type 3 domain-containing protein
MRHAIVGLFLLTAGCGKVGDPLPPFVRVPGAVRDLAVHQSGHNLILTWTNPARNIDGSAATDLKQIQIRSNDSVIATINVNAAGQTQSHEVPVDPTLLEQRTFTVRAETARGKLSETSNPASITPVEVPGKVAGLKAVVDQRKITLNWGKPQDHPELADVYRVNRIDPPDEPVVVMETSYEDDRYQAGRTYAYEITAVRRFQNGMVSGVGPEPITVLAEDRTPPQVPSGLDVVLSDTGAFVTWTANSEADLAGYRLFRSDRADGEFKLAADRLITTNAFIDSAYRAGSSYAVSAVDEFGNESARSGPFRVP